MTLSIAAYLADIGTEVKRLVAAPAWDSQRCANSILSRVAREYESYGEDMTNAQFELLEDIRGYFDGLGIQCVIESARAAGGKRP